MPRSRSTACGIRSIPCCSSLKAIKSPSSTRPATIPPAQRASCSSSPARLRLHRVVRQRREWRGCDRRAGDSPVRRQDLQILHLLRNAQRAGSGERDGRSIAEIVRRHGDRSQKGWHGHDNEPDPLALGADGRRGLIMARSPAGLRSVRLSRPPAVGDGQHALVLERLRHEPGILGLLRSALTHDDEGAVSQPLRNARATARKSSGSSRSSIRRSRLVIDGFIAGDGSQFETFDLRGPRRVEFEPAWRRIFDFQQLIGGSDDFR